MTEFRSKGKGRERKVYPIKGKKEAKGQRKVPIYWDGEYYDSLEYREPITFNDNAQLLDDTLESLEEEKDMIKDIHVGADRLGNIAVFVKSN